MTAAGGMFDMAVGQFLKAAQVGGFAVSETGGKALLEAIKDMAEWVDTNLSRSDVLAQQLPLGSSNGANQMKPYMQHVATDQQGFITQLREFRTSLTAAEEGIIAAMKNYNNIDKGVEGNVRAV